MDTRLDYPTLAKKVLNDYVDFIKGSGMTSLRTLFDDNQQRYVLLRVDWEKEKYIHYLVTHLEIIGGKIWILKDNTEEGVATDLLEAGVPKEHIVLGFKPPTVRPYTEFAAA
jgi:hypothetical protein